jgi:hypothetical protein
VQDHGPTFGAKMDHCGMRASTSNTICSMLYMLIAYFLTIAQQQMACTNLIVSMPRPLPQWSRMCVPPPHDTWSYGHGLQHWMKLGLYFSTKHDSKSELMYVICVSQACTYRVPCSSLGAHQLLFLQRQRGQIFDRTLLTAQSSY